MDTGTWGLYYNYTWWGNAIQTAPSVIGKPDFFGSQFKLLTSEQDNLVVNGDFSDGLNGWSTHSGSILELENGMAKVTTSNNSGWIKRTDLPIENGKTYFCKADITNAINKTWYINGTGNIVPLTLISGNTYGGYVTLTGNNPTFYIKGNQTNGEVTYIDNVSVQLVRADNVEAVKCLADWIHETQILDV